MPEVVQGHPSPITKPFLQLVLFRLAAMSHLFPLVIAVLQNGSPWPLLGGPLQNGWRNVSYPWIPKGEPLI